MTPESLGRLFWDRVSRSGAKAAQRVKADKAWRDVSWQALGEEVREVALGLMALGRQPGDAVALLSQTRGEWVRADFAILSAGCVTIPVYPSYPPETLAYIVRDSEARTLFVEDQQQLRKALAAAAEMPTLESVVLIDGSAQGSGGTRLRVLDWEGLRALGRGTHPPGGARGAPGRHQVRERRDDRVHLGDDGRPEGRRPDACEPSRRPRHDRGGLRRP